MSEIMAEEYVEPKAEQAPVERDAVSARIAALEEDNSALRAMLQRSASSTNAYRDASASEKVALINEKLLEDLRAERERRMRAEANFAQTKDQLELQLLKRDADNRKLTEALKKSKAEIEDLRRREREAEAANDAMRREHAQMKETLKRSKLNVDGTNVTNGTASTTNPPDYSRTANAKPFSLLRSVSPATNSPSNRQANNILGAPPRGLMPRITKQQPHDADAPARRGKYSSADPLRQAGASTTSISAMRQASKSPSARRTGSLLPEYKVGSKVVWQGVQGHVRYVGIVHCLGSGTWFGVELSDSTKGEHNGTLSGVKYFSAPNKTGIFCKMAELSAPRAPPAPRGAGASASLESPTKPESGLGDESGPLSSDSNAAGVQRSASQPAATGQRSGTGRGTSPAASRPVSARRPAPSSSTAAAAEKKPTPATAASPAKPRTAPADQRRAAASPNSRATPKKKTNANAANPDVSIAEESQMIAQVPAPAAENDAQPAATKSEEVQQEQQPEPALTNDAVAEPETTTGSAEQTDAPAANEEAEKVVADEVTQPAPSADAVEPAADSIPMESADAPAVGDEAPSKAPEATAIAEQTEAQEGGEPQQTDARAATEGNEGSAPSAQPEDTTTATTTAAADVAATNDDVAVAAEEPAKTEEEEPTPA